jgi:transcriptional regulator with XRE-family HTH domain
MQTNFTLNEMLISIGHKLYITRHSRREKITTVANNVGISHPVISQIENGRYTGLSLKLLDKIAAYYGMSLSDLLRQDIDSYKM